MSTRGGAALAFGGTADAEATTAGFGGGCAAGTIRPVPVATGFVVVEGVGSGAARLVVVAPTDAVTDAGDATTFAVALGCCAGARGFVVCQIAPAKPIATKAATAGNATLRLAGGAGVGAESSSVGGSVDERPASVVRSLSAGASTATPSSVFASVPSIASTRSAARAPRFDAKGRSAVASA